MEVPGATEEDGYVDESAGQGDCLAGGKAWGYTKTVRRLPYGKTGEETGLQLRLNKG
jgi:hypothetical protein